MYCRRPGDCKSSQTRPTIGDAQSERRDRTEEYPKPIHGCASIGEGVSVYLQVGWRPQALRVYREDRKTESRHGSLLGGPKRAAIKRDGHDSRCASRLCISTVWKSQESSGCLRHQGTLRRIRKRVMVFSSFAWLSRVASVPHGASALWSLEPRQESAPQVATGGRSTAASILFREASRCSLATAFALLKSPSSPNRTKDPHRKPLSSNLLANAIVCAGSREVTSLRQPQP